MQFSPMALSNYFSSWLHRPKPLPLTLGPDGYKIFRQVVPQDHIQRAIEAISQFTRADPENAETWLRLPRENFGIVPLHHAQAFWDNRQHPAVYEVFKQIYGLEQLWVSMDRAIFRPPESEAERNLPSAGWYLGYGDVHWDIDPRQPHPGWVQGVLLLSETPSHAGGFHCAPSIYKKLQAWLDAHPNMDWQKPDIADDLVVHVTGEAGDLIVWDPFLPHGASRNFHSRPRLAQYIAMAPVARHSEAERQKRITRVKERRPPEQFYGLIGQQNPEPGPPVALSPLGRKLAGLDVWD